MTAFKTAWADYLASLDEARQLVEDHPASASKDVREAGLYLPMQLQSVAFNMYLGPRPAYPQLYHIDIFSLFERNWGMPNPDYIYRFAFLDGARRYRLSGPARNNNPWFNIQVFKGWWGDPDNGPVAEIDLSENDGDDGVEVILGPEGAGPVDVALDPGNWNHVLNIREAVEDWTEDTMTPLRIECLDRGPGDTLELTEAQMVERLARAAKMVRSTAQRTVRNQDRLLAAAGETNRFFVDIPTAERAANNAHMSQTMTHCIFDLEPDQALIIEVDLPARARYWGIQMADVWWRTANWAYEQTSLNRKTAHIGADGKFVAVVSHEDPGIQNWLSTAGLRTGQICNRLNLPSDTPCPEAKVVRFAELRRHLPGDVPAFSAAERAQQLQRRREAAFARFHI